MISAEDLFEAWWNDGLSPRHPALEWHGKYKPRLKMVWLAAFTAGQRATWEEAAKLVVTIGQPRYHGDKTSGFIDYLEPQDIEHEFRRRAT